MSYFPSPLFKILLSKSSDFRIILFTINQCILNNPRSETLYPCVGAQLKLLSWSQRGYFLYLVLREAKFKLSKARLHLQNCTVLRNNINNFCTRTQIFLRINQFSRPLGFYNDIFGIKIRSSHTQNFFLYRSRSISSDVRKIEDNETVKMRGSSWGFSQTLSNHFTYKTLKNKITANIEGMLKRLQLEKGSNAIYI